MKSPRLFMNVQHAEPLINFLFFGTGAKPALPVRKGLALYEDQAFLASQSGTALLDKFTHCLVVKCSADMLDTLLTTLIRQLQPSTINRKATTATTDNSKAVVRRFVRSIARLFVVLSIETPPSQNKKKSPAAAVQPLQRCKRAFQALINIAIEELCETANALLAPVRLGVARPTAPLPLTLTAGGGGGGGTDSLSAMDDLFNVDPMMTARPPHDGGGGGGTNPMDRPSGGVGGSRRRRRDDVTDTRGGGGSGGEETVAMVRSILRPRRVEQPTSTSSQNNMNDTVDMERDDNDDQRDDEDRHDRVGDDDDGGDDGGDDGDDRPEDGAGAIEREGDVTVENDDGQQSDMDLDLLAESESESEGEGEGGEGVGGDANSTAAGGAQSIQTGATAGSDALFSDDDSSESSSHPVDEEDESDTGETDEQGEDDFQFPEDQLERRSTVAATTVAGAGGGIAERANPAPQTMQWAVRARTKPGRGGAGGGGGGGGGGGTGGFIYIDPNNLRRTTATGGSSSAAAAAAAAGEPVNMASTCSSLTRAFGIVIRQIADLLTMLQDYSALAPTLPRTLEISYQESINLQLMIEYQMKPNWDWLMTILDSTEAQLRFGSALSSITSDLTGGGGGVVSAHASAAAGGPSGSLVRAPRGSTAPGDHHRVGYTGAGFRTAAGGLVSGAASDPVANRRDFLNYALSLMRAHNSEHSDSLPVLDVSALKHVAYVFDALIYYMRSGTEEARRGAGAGADGGGGGGSFASLYTPLETDDDERDGDDVDEIPLGLASDRSANTGAADAMETESGDEETTTPSAIAMAAQGKLASR